MRIRSLKKNISIFQRRSSVGVKRALPEPPVVCMTPSPRPRCRIRTNPWLGSTSPNPRRRPHLLHQQSLQCPPPPPLVHAPYSLDSHPARFNRWVKYKADSVAMSLHVFFLISLLKCPTGGLALCIK